MTDLVRVTRGIWRPRATLDDLAARSAAVLRALPEGTVLAGAVAARLHGLWLPSDLERSDRIDVILRTDAPAPAPEKLPGCRRAEVRGRRRHVDPSEVVTVSGLPVTSPARTWCDLAETLRMPDLVAAGDSALRTEVGAAVEADPHRTLLEMTYALRRARYRRGVRAARAALPLLDHRSRSRPESHMRYAIVTAQLPVPAVNEPIHSQFGEWLGEPDLSYDDVRLAIEYNGADHADPQRMRRDITRQLDLLQRGGWAMLVFGPAEVFGRPDQLAGAVALLRREREHLRDRDVWRLR